MKQESIKSQWCLNMYFSYKQSVQITKDHGLTQGQLQNGFL